MTINMTKQKAILEIDMPENCCKCDIFASCVWYKNYGTMASSFERHPKCPLKLKPDPYAASAGFTTMEKAMSELEQGSKKMFNTPEDE